MIYLGMIFQYDEATSTGLIMLNDGEQGKFSSFDWIDTENIPSVGQKISYENSNGRIKIRVATQEDKDRALLDEEKESDAVEDPTEHFTNIDEYIKYFTEIGYKIIKDAKDDQVRKLSLRLYTPTDFGEATIVENGSEISVTQILNGKLV